MVASLFRALSALTLALVIAACTTATPPSQSFPPITFAQNGPIKLTVSRVEVVHEYLPPLTAPNVEHQVPIPPAAMAQRWAQDRLVASGGVYVGRFVIKRASVVQSQLPRTEGIRAVFTKDQDKKYDAELEVELQIRDERGIVLGVVTAAVGRSTTTPEDITLADREKVWYDMVKDIGATLNADLDRNIRSSLGTYTSF